MRMKTNNPKVRHSMGKTTTYIEMDMKKLGIRISNINFNFIEKHLRLYLERFFFCLFMNWI